MKNYIKFPLVLGSIALVSGLLIGGIYMLTAPVIIENNAKKEQAALSQIYTSTEEITYQYTELDRTFENDYLEKVWSVTNAADSAAIGYIYRASGKNAYGGITLMTGINVDTSVHGNPYMISNTESFAKEVNTWASTTDFSDPSNIDTKCGATYGAKLVQSLIIAARDDVVRGGF